MSRAAKNAPWCVQHAPDVGKAFGGFMTAANEQGLLDKKTKDLLMVALACAFRCPLCTEEHIEGAKEADASEAESARRYRSRRRRDQARSCIGPATCSKGTRKRAHSSVGAYPHIGTAAPAAFTARPAPRSANG
jgi:AhpD family alkylhydroperoxidase